MPLEPSSSIVLDSEPPSPPVVSKPARKTYGRAKPKEPAADAAAEGSRDALARPVPSRRPRSKTPETVPASDPIESEDDNDATAAAATYAFAWQAQLKEMDRSDDEQDEVVRPDVLRHTLSTPDAPPPSTPPGPTPAETSSARSSPEHAFPRRQSPLPSPSKSPGFPDQPADDDRLVPSTSSTVQSSPEKHQETPPTSDDDMPPIRSKASKPSRRVVSPSPPSRIPSESKKKGKAKLKAPTHKELKETAKEKIRLAARTHASVPRSQKVIYDLGSLLSGIHKQDSDPIQNFSSPAGQPPAKAKAHIIRKGMSHSTIGEARSDDDELPDPDQLVAESKSKPSQDLQEFKARALAQQQQRDFSDSDDDLLVQDDVMPQPQRKIIDIGNKAALDVELCRRHEEQAAKLQKEREVKWSGLGGVRDGKPSNAVASTMMYVEVGMRNYAGDNQDPDDADEEDEGDEELSPHRYEEIELGRSADDEMEYDEDGDHDRTMVEADSDNEEEHDHAIRQPRRRTVVLDDSDVEMDENTPMEVQGDEQSDEGDDKENNGAFDNEIDMLPSSRALLTDRDDELRRPLRTLEEGPESPVIKQLSFMERLVPTSDTSPNGFQFTPLKFGGEASFSQSSQETLHDTPTLQPGFDDLFLSTTQKTQKSQRLTKEDTFTRLFGNARKTSMTDLALTQDIPVWGPIEVEDDLKQKAEAIFLREQEFLQEEARASDQKEPELYVNDNGFLTQTRPSDDATLYRASVPTPSQASNFLSPLLTQGRNPLSTLAFTPTSPSQPQRMSRLRHRASGSLSPSRPQRLVPRPKEKLGKSEYVQQEADESDEDDMRGFGGGPAEDDDEPDDEDQDKELATLVDHKHMSEEEIAQEKVQEKFKEQQEQQDFENEKFVKGVTEGQMRLKRKGGLGFGEDSDDEGDYDDEANRRRREKMMAKEIPGNIQDLGQIEETKAFADAYRVPEDEFADGLGELESEEPVDNDPEHKQEEVDSAEVWRELRAAPMDDDDAVPFDPEDISHIDVDGDSDQENTIVKVADSKRAAAGPNKRRRVDDDQEFDVPGLQRGASHRSEVQIAQEKRWAKDEARNHRHGASTRSTRSAAITGHGSVKSGSGSLRKNTIMKQSSSASAHPAKRAPVKAAPSFLGTVNNRKQLFE